MVVPINEDERLAREAYWHHSFDEWYLSNKLASREIGYMWAEFYKPAIVSGYDEPALRSILEELLKDPEKGFREYTKEFMSSLGDTRGKRLRRGRLLPRHLR